MPDLRPENIEGLPPLPSKGARVDIGDGKEIIMKGKNPNDFTGINLDANVFVRQFGEKRVWLNWRLESKRGKDGLPERDSRGDFKLTKVPYRLDGSFGSSTDETSWCTFKETFSAKERFTGIGFVFEPSLNIVGVDFDHCVDPSDGWIDDPLLKKFIDEANTYTELSPSGTGLHAFFQLPEAYFPEANKRPVSGFEDFPITEIYARGRYFTFTGESYGPEKPVRSVTKEELDKILGIVGYPWKRNISTESSADIIPHHTMAGAPYVSPIPDDVELLDRMFESKGGDKAESLYKGDLSEYNDDHSAADLAFCGRLAFWTGKDPERMLRIWLSSPLGKREKTQTRLDYQKRTIDKAIAGCIDVFRGNNDLIPQAGTVPVVDDYMMSGGKNPVPLLILENVCRVIERDEKLAAKFRYNDFSHMVETVDDKSGEWRNLVDNDIIGAQRYIAVNYPDFAKISKMMLTDAILYAAHAHMVNPPRDYMVSLQWDGKPRLDSWLYNAYGTPDDPLHQAIGSNWLKGVVKRVMRPGCQFDEVLVLESPQGWRKSTSLRVLAQPWHVETTQSTDDKDFYMILAQNMVVEFSEGEVMTRTEIKKLKAIITKVEDQYRPPYERGMSTFKRGCVFAMTTNDTEYQKDDTGGRRWLPVELKKPADIDWLIKNRDQLFAEAYHRVIENNETTYEYPEELAELQESRMEHSDYEEAIVDWYLSLLPNRRNEGITVRDIYHAVISPPSDNGTPREMNRLAEMQIAGMLKRALHLFKKDKKIDGVVRKRWFPSLKTEKMFGLEHFEDEDEIESAAPEESAESAPELEDESE